MENNTAKLPPLTVEDYAAAKCLPLDWLQDVWHVTSAHPPEFGYSKCVALDYGNGIVRYRSGDPKDRFRWKKGSKGKLRLYGQEQLIRKADWCIVVEGESDTQTLSLLGYPVLGVPGTQTWAACIKGDPDVLKLLDGKLIVVIQEPPDETDTPAKLVQEIANTFPPAKVITVKLWQALGDKDISDLWKRNYEDAFFDLDRSAEFFRKDFKKAFTNAIATSAIVMPDSEKKQLEKVTQQISDVLASSITMKLTKWLWKDHVPLNHVSVFAGMPQKGKSTAACDFIARLTTGAHFPFAENTIGACEVAILATEDDKDETIVPRLTAAGANLDRVRFPFPVQQDTAEWEIALDRDLPALKKYLQERPAVRLLVIDPVTSYIGDVDPNKPKEVRPFLNKLKAFAKEMNITVMLIMHLSKNPDVSALHRVGGAATWIEVPRAVWFFDLKPDQEDGVRPLTYVMVNGKLNLVADDQKKSLEYQFASVDVPIEDQVASIGRIQWGSASDLELDGLYKKDRLNPGPEPKKTEAAMKWLQTELAVGEKPASDLFAGCEASGHTVKTLREAAKRLGIEPHREFPNKGRWMWKLPAAEVETNY